MLLRSGAPLISPQRTALGRFPHTKTRHDNFHRRGLSSEKVTAYKVVLAREVDAESNAVHIAPIDQIAPDATLRPGIVRIYEGLFAYDDSHA